MSKANLVPVIMLLILSAVAVLFILKPSVETGWVLVFFALCVVLPILIVDVEEVRKLTEIEREFEWLRKAVADQHNGLIRQMTQNSSISDAELKELKNQVDHLRAAMGFKNIGL